MASYEAIINLVVQGEAALNRIQKKIDNLYKTVGDLETKKKFRGSQAAAEFVREQADELERVVSVSKKQIKEQERSIVKQSKLNAAVDLYERRQRQLSRTSVANQKQFADQIKDIEEGFKFFKDRKSATGVQAIATELGRIIEYDNEINRISERRTANQRRLFAFSKEIAKYESFGLKTDRARKTLSNFEEVAGSNQLKKAQQYEAALRNQLKLLKDQFTEQQRVAKIAPSSPVRGGINFPGSPIAVAAQQRAQEIALQRAQRGFPASPIGGTATMLGSPKFLAAQEKARSAAERALRAQERSAKAAENAANKEADRILKESQKGFPASPIMGTVTMMGSPRAIAAQERNRAAAERRAATQRKAEERAAKVQQQVVIAAERAADKALKEAQKGFPSSPILGSVTTEGSPRWKVAQESARQKLESAARAVERAADRALKEAQKGFPSSPILGTATMTGSPRWRAAQERIANAVSRSGSTTGFPSSPIRGGVGFPGSPIFNETPFLERRFGKRGGAAISEGLIGGAFPLLFGQGIGAAVGGGLGGAAGGFAGGGLGFGLSLVGTALGTAFDTAVQSAIELGGALQKPIENFDKLAEKSFFSSKALEETIRKTIDYGDSATASAMIQEEAIKKLGVDGIQNLKTLGTESDRLNRAFAELGQQMQAVAAGPLSSVIGFFADIAGQAAAAGRVKLLRSNLNEQQSGQFNQEILGRLKERGIQRGFFAPNAPTESEIGMLEQQGALQDIVDKFQPLQLKGNIIINPKQKIESEINALQKQLESIDISKPLKDQFRSAAREQQDLDRQRADLVRSYEESIANIRKQVEDEIRNKRFATLEKENQLLDTQGQIRLRQLQIVNQAAVASAGTGQRPEAEQAAKEIAQLVAQFTEQQVSAEEEAASIKRNAALDVQKIDSEAAQFKAGIEKEVSRLNIDTARRVGEINEQVGRRNEEFDRNRFTLEKRIAELQLKNNEILTKQQLDTARKNATAAQQAGDQQQAAYAQSVVNIYEAQLDIIKKGQKDISAIAAPAPLRGVGAVGGGGVSTTGLDKATADYKTAVANYVEAQLRLNELDVVKNAQAFALGIAEFANKTDAALAAIQTRESDAEIERLRYIELVNAGLTDTVAQKILELEATKRVSLAVYDAAIAQLESKIVAGQVTEEIDAQNRKYLEQIDILRKRKDALEGKFGEVDTTTGKGTGAIGSAIKSDRGKKIQEFIAQATTELNDLEAVAVRVSQGIGDAIANSMANGITGLVEGTTTAKEVFAGFLKDIGNILIKEGTRMIGMYVAIGIAKMFAGLLGGAGGAGKPALPGSMGKATTTGITTGAGNVSDMLSGLAANGAYFASGVAAFANGGIFTNSVVSSPTLFKFAEGGVQRTGLMGEAGPEAIMPLRRSASGRLGVDANGLREAMASGGGSMSGAPTLNMSFETTSIGGVEYVSRDQLEAAMAATRRDAARDGAKRGMSMTLDKLQQSPGTRGRVGLR